MKRFLSTIVAVAATLAVSAQGFGEIETITEDWRFNLGDIKYGGVEFYDHSKWQEVDLPHDWTVLQTASPNYASCTGYLPGGIAWYRKDLSIDASREGQNVYVYFEGVYNNSEVFINGKWVGKRPNGYISFMYDLTPYINFGGRNVIAVRVDHSDDADSRWYTGSGIYRDVHLVYANPTHIDLWGVSYSADIKQLNKAAVTVNCAVNNTVAKSASVSAKFTLTDATGKVVAARTVKGSVDAKDKKELSALINVTNPNLWSVDNPYLYKLTTELYSGSKLIDKTSTNVGLRKLTFDANKGFAINDVPTKMKGVCIHHDAGCLGAAVPKEVWVRRIAQLKSIGCNAVRLSHNPQATDLYDVCDSLGMMVKDEAFDEWEYPKKKWIKGWNKGTPGFQGSSQYFREWSHRDVADMVKRDRNHPSVVLWSIGNEVDYPNDPYSHPILNEGGKVGQQHDAGYKPELPNANRLGEIAADLASAVREHDTSRPVTGAMAGAVMSNETGYPAAIDVVGYNYTEYRYDQDHATYPNRILYGSETRHDLAAWKSVRDNEFIFGQFIWTGYDYLGESGAWPSRGFTTGMIDLAANIKPRGFFRRALWSETPAIYVGTYINHTRPGQRGENLSTHASQIWNYEDGQTVRVVAYTNCEEAELLLDGKVIGEKKPYDDSTAIIYWDVPYKAGELSVKGYNKGEVVSTDSVKTFGMPVKLSASFDKTTISSARETAHLFIEVLDKDGNVVGLADNEVTVRVMGPARLLGLESGSNNVADNYTDNKQRCIGGRLLGYIQSTGEKGEVRIMLSTPLIKDCEVTLTIE
ncbi:MAG: glycoside hydrolase family 2 TIM barrel-domain containing protein [Rikenellaceae bacterium]